jgi:hypothetical protein
MKMPMSLKWSNFVIQFFFSRSDRGRSSSLMFWSPTENSPDDKPDFQKQFITVAGVTVSHSFFHQTNLIQ